MAADSPPVVFAIQQCGYTANGITILSEVDLEIGGGKLYGLIGPNGSGKTSLLRLLTGTAQPSCGQVLLHGRAVHLIPKSRLARCLSYVPQTFSLEFDYSVEEVVMMGRHPYIGRFGAPTTADRCLVDDALHALDIASLRNRYVTHLSGGECQRVLVARALAQNAPTLILDEATANLDIRHSIDIMQALRARVRQQGSTIVTAIHDLDLAAAYCDELIVLSAGRLHATGSVEDLLTRDLLLDIFGVEATIVFPERQTPHIQYRYHHA